MKSFIRVVGALFFNRPEVEADAPASAVVAGPKPTVLLIDDDVALLDGLRPVVRMAGYNVLSTTSATKGLDLLRFDNNNVRLAACRT